ncbi:GNAT family N-acetyltransferase [Streptomyces oceani]|uniref:Acetyltransferase n=1 Tax=Streptomyces oceani TaxID=1075402 RepID=A0A1E7KJZ3_9ACTN|nr:GNAT family N-acetyltransferase [Streptomyces oceani]OEV04322.1 acetyltransferase [Streptomyces oceani]
MTSITVTTWWLEQRAPEDLAAVHLPDDASNIRIACSGTPSPEFSRFLYTAAGGDVTWTDRLGWTYARWREFLERPGVETWVAYVDGTPAGFIELNGAGGDADTAAEVPPDTVEISYFGLLPAFRGRGIGGHLLSYGTARAWDMAQRLPGRAPTSRVWLHTCSKDGPHALRNYERRGFRLYDTTTGPEPERATPGPWPEAGPTGLA